MYTCAGEGQETQILACSKLISRTHPGPEGHLARRLTRKNAHCVRCVLRVCLFARRVRNQLSEGMVPGQGRNQVDFMAADYMKPSISKQAAHPSIAFASLRHEGASPAVSGRCECRADCRQRLDGHGGSSRVYCGARDTRALSTSSETRIKDTAF